MSSMQSLVATAGDISHQAELLGCRAAGLCVFGYLAGTYTRVSAERGVCVGDKERCHVRRREEKTREEKRRENNHNIQCAYHILRSTRVARVGT